MTSIRFQKILALIPLETPLVFDVGTDHGFLAIESILNRQVKKVYATDLRPKPLAQAAMNIQKFGLESQIKLKLSFGLNFVAELDEKTIALCIISGLGSAKIEAIIQQDHPQIHSYVFCANTEIKNLRTWVFQQKYTISHEDFFWEKNHPYWLIKIEKKPTKTSPSLLHTTFGDFQWFKNNLAYRQYLLSLWKNRQKIAKLITSKNKKKNWETENRLLESYLKLWNY